MKSDNIIGSILFGSLGLAALIGAVFFGAIHQLLGVIVGGLMSWTLWAEHRRERKRAKEWEREKRRRVC